MTRKHKRDEDNNVKTRASKRSSHRLFSPSEVLNTHVTYFITNPSDDESKGSSLYFVSPSGTIRCRTDLTDKNAPPVITINPFRVGYNTRHKKHTETFTPTIGLYPFETEMYRIDKNDTHRRSHHGNIITEIISVEQFNDSCFVPTTWVNREDVGLLWHCAVNYMKEAQAKATLNIHGHYVREKTILQGNNKDQPSDSVPKNSGS